MASIEQLVNRIREIEFPVLKLEMRVRQRKARPFIVMGVYVGVMSALVLFLYADWLRRNSLYGKDPSDLGRLLFMWLPALQLGLIWLIVPNLGAGSVTTEKQRRSLEMLMVTPLSTASIVLQKSVAVAAEAVMLLVASVPVMSVAFMLGGVSPAQIAGVFAVLIVCALALGALGVMWSCMLKDTRSAALASTLTVLVTVVGLPTGLAYLDSLAVGSAGTGPVALLDAMTHLAIPASFVLGGLMSALGGRRLRGLTASVSPLVRCTICYGAAIFLLAAFGCLEDAVAKPNAVLTDYFTQGHPLMTIAQISDVDSSHSDMARNVLWTLGLGSAYIYTFHRISVLKLDRLRRP